MQAIETTGTIDQEGQLRLKEPLPLKAGEVKLIILYPSSEVPADDTEEMRWLRAASNNPAFDFLKEEEDIYSLSDGRHFHGEA